MTSPTSPWIVIAALSVGFAFGSPRAIAEPPAAAPTLRGTVVRVLDGDSLQVRLDSGPIEVRLHAADAPEYDQPGGREARHALDRRLAPGTIVELEPIEQDRYQRIVAVVYAGVDNVNAWLVQQGHAWAYRHYTTDERYCRWEHAARRAKRGLWGLSASARIAPWDWRHRARDPAFRPAERSSEALQDCIAALDAHRKSPAR
ncbi:MAG TPA: thermonuclease family protein [Steroidobacteraceae bacterium]|nr:thermonuclease family protein [Steroidobacteraceae bacterium]